MVVFLRSLDASRTSSANAVHLRDGRRQRIICRWSAALQRPPIAIWSSDELHRVRFVGDPQGLGVPFDAPARPAPRFPPALEPVVDLVLILQAMVVLLILVAVAAVVAVLLVRMAIKAEMAVFQVVAVVEPIAQH